MRVFVGLGEGIGNVIMGLPLVDGLHAAGHEVFLSLRPTPPSIERDLLALVEAGRPWLQRPFVVRAETGPDFDAACLTFWWLYRGGKMPKARETFIGGAPSENPEILANLDAARTLAPGASPRARLFVDQPLPRAHGSGAPIVAIHPGCKPDKEWRERKVYPRWAEVTHRLKEAGAEVWIVGSPADAEIYCGEPTEDFRGWNERPLSLLDTARILLDAHALVSGDSGLFHMAVALGLPTVALFHGSSVGKATHPDAAISPVLFQTDGKPFSEIDPRLVAATAYECARRTTGG